MRWLALCILLLSSIVYAQSGDIFLVRHAEKVSQDKDPDLSAAGKARAECLAKSLRDAKIRTIFVTEYKRTRQTAEPLAKASAISAKVIPAANTQAAAEAAKNAAQDGAVLIVGHSNTIPPIVNQLGGPPIAMGDADYDQLFIVHMAADRSAGLTTLHVCQAEAAAK